MNTTMTMKINEKNEKVQQGIVVGKNNHNHKNRNNNKRQRSLYSMISGSVAGAATRLIISPFDVLKIRLQIEMSPITKENPKIKLSYITRSIYKYEGILGFWKGNLAATYLWMSYGGVQFATYSYLNSSSSPTSSESWFLSSSIKKGIHGAIAASCATAVTYPFDWTRTALASQVDDCRARNLLSQIYKKEGIFGFYRGLCPSLLQIVPYMATSFFLYDVVQNHYPKEKSVMYTIGSGATAGFGSKLLVYPLDTVKRRMQVKNLLCYPSTSLISDGRINKTSTWNCRRTIKMILKKEGIIGFYRGVTPSLLKSVVSHSSTFAIYELLNRYLLMRLDGDTL